MQRHWKRPWISLAVLAAVAGSMLAWPAPASQAQATTYPGQTDPVGNRPGGLTQFPDDELLTLNDADSTQYSLVEYSPNADYSLPAAVDADVLQYRPTGQLPYTPGGYQIQNETASGRIVVPDRDVALTLSKTGTANSTHLLGAAGDELRHGRAQRTQKRPRAHLDPQTFGLTRSEDSPGALAIGDVDRALTPNATYGATYNDEAVVAYEILGNIEPARAARRGELHGPARPGDRCGIHDHRHHEYGSVRVSLQRRLGWLWGVRATSRQYQGRHRRYGRRRV